MTACLLCSSPFHGLSLTDKDVAVRAARDFILGLFMSVRDGDNLKSFQASIKPLRRGVCVVERCARAVETACGGCREADCQRCVIAAELRAAEDRINAERDAEIADMGFDDRDVEGVIDRVAMNLCGAHVTFGSVLVGEWYNRQNFLSAPLS